VNLIIWDLLSGDVKPANSVLVYDGTGRQEAVSTAELGYAERPVHLKELHRLK
jgi:hypothetical protein